MECRQSGLSDCQWCQRQEINVGTFYNWVSKLRKSGYTIPDSKSKSEGTALIQDVVKVNLVNEDISSPVIEQNAHPLVLENTPSVAAELVAGNVTLRLFNGAD
ncbi:MAG: IS66 family insertion sequence element accessory protein TnpB [Clostridiales bacterium]|nr:IS66 family insertion sequence element accessory protein TnpB [Clostridiales bacterium]